MATKCLGLSVENFLKTGKLTNAILKGMFLGFFNSALINFY